MTFIFPSGQIGTPTGGGGGGGDINIVGTPLIQVTTDGDTVTLRSASYVFEQGVASDTWVIQHNLNKYPSVVTVDSAGSVFGASVVYEGLNKCTVYINGATTGRAYLN